LLTLFEGIIIVNFVQITQDATIKVTFYAFNNKNTLIVNIFTQLIFRKNKKLDLWTR